MCPVHPVLAGIDSRTTRVPGFHRKGASLKKIRETKTISSSAESVWIQPETGSVLEMLC